MCRHRSASDKLLMPFCPQSWRGWRNLLVRQAALQNQVGTLPKKVRIHAMFVPNLLTSIGSIVPSAAHVCTIQHEKFEAIHYPNRLVLGNTKNGNIYIYIYLSLSLSLHLCIYLSISLSLHLSLHLSVYLSIYPSIHPPIYLSICLSIYLSIYRSIYLSIYIYLSLSLSLHLSIHLSIGNAPNQMLSIGICWTFHLQRREATMVAAIINSRGSLFFPKTSIRKSLAATVTGNRLRPFVFFEVYKTHVLIGSSKYVLGKSQSWSPEKNSQESAAAMVIWTRLLRQSTYLASTVVMKPFFIMPPEDQSKEPV